jgi:FO synthase
MKWGWPLWQCWGGDVTGQIWLTTAEAREAESVIRHTSVQTALEVALTGQTLSAADGYALMVAPPEALPEICGAARRLTKRCKGSTITYSRKVFIPLTTLCRDSCGYCTFVKAPGNPAAQTLNPDEVLAIARAGENSGCKEALFSLGERPELRHELAREHLRSLGYATMLEYLYAMCALVLRETKLVPHVNPGALTYAEISALRPVSPSMGMMLESVSERLTERGAAHHGCPDKRPTVRLNTLRAAGELCVPFTTGILIGIGETRVERVDSLLALRRLQADYGHIQEVIVQNFRAKVGTRMEGCHEPDVDEMLRTLAVARLLLGGEMNLQAPPNLTPGEYGRYLSAGINDWGGISPVTPDHINPEASWPKIRELKAVCAREGYTLRERLSVYPGYLREPAHWLHAAFREALPERVDASGLVEEATMII